MSMTLTCEYWRRSCGRDGHHKHVFSLGLHHEEVLKVSQRVWSEVDCVLTAHPWGDNTPLTWESPCQNM